jgi:hypothetical protein
LLKLLGEDRERLGERPPVASSQFFTNTRSALL